MRLLIIRHGDPDYEHNDLTPAGKHRKKEAEESGKNEEEAGAYES